MRALYTARIHVSSLPPECFPHACAPLMINANSTDIREKKKEREREIAGISREKRNRILQLWFECGKATPLSKRFCFILCCPIRMNEIDGSMDGERVYKRFASSVSKWLLFVSCRWKNFVNNHARVFGLKRSRDFFRAMESIS